MTSAQEAEIKLKTYEGLNDNDPSGIQIHVVPYSKEMTLQGESCWPRNVQNMNQIQDVTVPRPNWKAILTCYKYKEKGHLA